MPEQPLDLASRIERAFLYSKYPGDAQLITAEPGVDFDADDAFDTLRGVTWPQLLELLAASDFAEMYHYENALFHISVSALAYYLPAYLIVAARQDRVAESLRDTIIFILSGQSGRIVRLKELNDLLTSEQKAYLVEWIKYVNSLYSQEEIGSKAADLWSKFAEEG